MKPVETLNACFDVFAPAKINLMLAVLGVREDGFHDLVSVATPLNFGDKIIFHWEEALSEDILCFSHWESDMGIKLAENSDNLILKALHLFREHVMLPSGSFRITLEKRIPVGAGLGGGSSDAVATLKGLNDFFKNPLKREELVAIANEIGSDCALFFKQRPVLVEGRGERISVLPDFVSDYLKNKKVLLFKIPLGVETAWAYGQMRKNPDIYCPSSEAQELLHSWSDPLSDERFRLYNNFEKVVFRKFPIIGVCLNTLRERGISALMSGSGSACFCLLDEWEDEAEMVRLLEELTGGQLFVKKTSFLPS